MNILQIMGCTSDQYASMEKYLVQKAKFLHENNSQFIVIYENTPVSQQFVKDFKLNKGILIQDRMNGIFDIHYALRIRKIIKDYKIDTVHVYFTPTCHFISFWLKLFNFTKIVRTAANMPVIGKPTGKKLLILKLRHKIFSLLYKIILCRSAGVKESFSYLSVPSKKLEVADGGCNTDLYVYDDVKRKNIREKYQIQDNCILLIAACRLVEVKGLDKLIFRVNDAIKEGFAVKLFILGNGPLDAELKDIINNKLNIKNNILLLGHIENLIDYYSAADIFCLSSSAEGMSNSLLEAMSCQLPVIASDIPANASVLKNEKSGLLINFDSSKDFINAIQFLNHKEKRQSIGYFNRNSIVNNFSLPARLAKEFKIYSNIIKI